jgi:hypothetical protein
VPVRTRRPAPLLIAAAAAALAAGCASPPVVVAGKPAPLTPVPTATGTPVPTRSPTTPGRTAPPTSPPPTRPAPTSPAPVRPAPALPAGYEFAELAAHGVTVRVPVPVGWIRRSTARGYDFGDPSETLLLRIEVTARSTGQTARQWWQTLEPRTAAQLPNYRRLDARDVPDYFDGALDWTFVFDGNGGRRQVIDRLLVSGPAAVAVYFSAVQRDFARLLPVWNQAKDGLTIS